MPLPDSLATLEGMEKDAQSPRGRFLGPSDLHLHSNRSDGTEDPAVVIRQAHAAGLRTIALTDHDTSAGWAEAGAEASALGMTLIPGMEISAREGWRSVHILAYLIDPEHPALLAELDRVREDRVGRAERIVRNIGRDYALRWEHVREQTRGDATVGRPHIADALIAQGIVRDRNEAFEGILHPREGYYEGHYAPDAVRVVELIAAAGGVSVIAHPATQGRQRIPEPLLLQLIDAGLGGVEIGHRENTTSGREWLRSIAARHDLIITGSSDYHGDGKPNRPGENTTEDEMVARILAQGTGTPPVLPR